MHIASAGGVWGTIVFGFAGMYDSGTTLKFSPRLPRDWDGVTFRIQRHGSRMVVDLDHDGCTVSVLDGPEDGVPIELDGVVQQVTPGTSCRIKSVDVPA